MAIHSKLTVFKLDSSVGVLTDISTYCNKSDFPEKLDLDDVTTFGVTSKQWLAGFADGDVNISGPWTRASHQFLSAIKTAFRDGTVSSVSVEYAPEGTSSGCIKKTAELIMTDYQTMSDVKGPVEWTAKFKVTGAVTETTY
jgi:hypothetical protein